jgi:epoxyqueuosine reductase
VFSPRSDGNPIDLEALYELDDEEFRVRFRHTPLWRPKRRGLLRNAAIALGNRPTKSAIPALIRGLNDHETLVRGACAWALGKQTGSEARKALADRLELESDVEVIAEIRAAMLTG